MGWYIRLPALLGKENKGSIDDLGDLSTRITNLYAAVLSYVMNLVCHFRRLDLDFPNKTFLPRDQSQTLQEIKHAEEILPLFNEDLVRLPLEKLYVASKKSTASSDEKEQVSEENRELLNDLHVVDSRSGMSSSHDEQSRVAHELYHLLLSTEQYRSFLDWDKPENQLLWISGAAGQGKTTLLTGVVQSLSTKEQKQHDCQCLSFFFFDYSRPGYDNAAAALRNLIWHLLIQQPSLAPHLEKKRETTGRKHFDSPNDFLALSGVFYDMIGDEDFSKTYFVVGTLNEYSSEKGQPGSDDLVDLITTSTKVTKNIRWLVSSNYSEKIKMAFEGHSRCLDMRADLHDSSAAVNNYIRDEVSRLALDKAYDEELKTTVADALRERSLGNLLWINIICTALRAEDIWHVESFLDEIKEIKDLKFLYHHMLKRIQDLPKDAGSCREVLQTMAVVRQSLHVNELKPLLRLAPRVDLMAILQKCSALLQVRNNVVSFRHQSARDHVREHFLDPTSTLESHVELTHRCLDVLANSLTTRSSGEMQVIHMNRARPGRDDTSAADNYASLHWMTHLYEICKTSDDANSKQVISRTSTKVQLFLEEHFLPWVYALLEEGQLPIAAVRLQKVDLFLQGKVSLGPETNMENAMSDQMPLQHPSWKELHSAIQDAHLFLRLHQATSSPKDVAASNTLLFCPTESRIRKHWMPKALPWVTTPPKINQHWAHNFATFEGHEDWIRTIAFSLDGRLIASGSDDSTVRIWDAETGMTQHSVGIQRGWVYCVAFSSQGIVAAGSDDYSVTLWEASTGHKLARLDDHDGTILALCFSPDGKKLVTASSGTVLLWEARCGDFKNWKYEKIHESNDDVRSVAFSVDGKLLVTGGDDCKIRVWDADTWILQRTFEGHESQVNAVAFSRDGKLLASGADDKTARIWDTNSADLKSDSDGEDESKNVKAKRQLHILEPGADKINSVAFSPDDEGSRLATATSHAIYVWDTKTGAKLRVLHSPSSNVRSVAFAPDMTYLASGSFDNGVHLWYTSIEPTDAAPAYQLPSQDIIYEIAVSPDGRTIAGGYDGGSVFLWDVMKEEMIQRDMQFGHEGSILSLSFSPDGTLLLSGSYDNSVRVCDVATGRRRHVFKGHGDWTRCVTWCDSGQYVASGSDDSSICVWSIGGEESQKPVKMMERAHEASYKRCVRCVAFSPDGKYLVSGGNNKKVVVWDWKTDGQEEKTTYTGHAGYILSVLVTRDSKCVISASSDNTVRIWGIQSGETQSGETQPPIKVSWVHHYEMWFPPQSTEYVMTPQGALSLSSSSDTRKPPAWSPWRLEYDREEDQWWVTFEGRNVIFIPRGFHPAFARVLEDKVIMVSASLQHIYVYGFSRNAILRR